MVTTRGTKPLPETQRDRRRSGSVGIYQKADSDQKKIRETEEERKAAMPSLEIEIWKPRKRKDGTRPSGQKIVAVRRNAKHQFLKKSPAQALAAHLGLMTGADVPPPKQKKPNT